MLKVDTQPYQHIDSLLLKLWSNPKTNVKPLSILTVITLLDCRKQSLGLLISIRALCPKSSFTGERMPPKFIVKQTGQMYDPLSSIPVWTQNLRLPKPRFFSNCRLSLFICEIFLRHVRMSIGISEGKMFSDSSTQCCRGAGSHPLWELWTLHSQVKKRQERDVSCII